MTPLPGPDSREPADLLISGGTILALDAADSVTEHGSVAVRGGRVVALGPEGEIAARFTPAETLDASGCVVMPGLVNAHTHAAMTLFRGLADDLPLMEWLNDHIFPAERKISREWVRAGTLLACAEMIASGTTAFCDMYLFEDAAAEAARDAGMRALVGEVLYDFPSPNYGPPEAGLRFTEDLAARWRGDPLVSVACEPHAVYTCSPGLLSSCRDLAERLDIPLVIHLSETESEVSGCVAAHGARPVSHLENLGLLSPRLIADHCVVLDDSEIALLARRGVNVAHCPESNMKLASGIAPVPRLLAAGANVAIGTDGCASNNDLDLFGEMDTCAKLHKVAALDPTVTPAREVVRMATGNGARALGLAGELGAIAPGRLADIICVDFSAPHLTPLYRPRSHLVYAARGADVRHSVIGGRVVMRDRRILTLDIEEVMERARTIARAVRG